jgi:hypothetical protein
VQEVEDAMGFILKADGVVLLVTVYAVHGGDTCAMRIRAITLYFAQVKAMPVIGSGTTNTEFE